MQPVFVETRNVIDFTATMQLVEKRHGHDSFGMLWGRAGRGKSRTAKWYAARNGSVYIESIRGWTELWMYQNILAAMGIDSPPARKKTCFEAILDYSASDPRTMFLDEADLIGPRLLESVRDLCRMMQVPWVLIGEESLPRLMGRDRRVWSRAAAALEFGPMDVSDIIALTSEATDQHLKLTPPVAEIIQQATQGDIRLIELVLSHAEAFPDVKKSGEITEPLAKRAIGKFAAGHHLRAC